MTKQEILAEGERLAEECKDAYFVGDEINGISPQTPDDSFMIGFEAAISLMLEREKRLREALLRIKSLTDSMSKRYEICSIVTEYSKQALTQVPEWEDGE